MRDTKVHEIDGYRYHVQQLGAKSGRAVLAKLLGILGPAADSQEPIARLAEKLTDADLDYLCDVFGKATQVENTDKPGAMLRVCDVFDDHFAGRYGAMLRWLWVCLETNYADFLGELSKIGARVGAAIPGKTPPGSGSA